MVTAEMSDGQFHSMIRDQTAKLDAQQWRWGSLNSSTHHYGEATMSSVLHHAFVEISPTGLALRHLPRVVFCSRPFFPSIFLRSLRSVPVTGHLRYYGRSDSCPPGSSAPACMNSVSDCGQVSLLHAPELPIPLSPTTRQPLDIALARYPLAYRASRRIRSGLHLWSAGSPVLAGRIEFVILRMDRSPPAALHPASRRRSCSRLQAGERMPGGDLHPSVQFYITTCACRRSVPGYFRNSFSCAYGAPGDA